MGKDGSSPTLKEGQAAERAPKMLSKTCAPREGAPPAQKKWGGKEIELMARRIPNDFYVVFA